MDRTEEAARILPIGTEYEICLFPTWNVQEYLMGLRRTGGSEFILEPIYGSLAEDPVCFENGQRRLYIHTTRLSEDGVYLHGCFWPGHGWAAGGEHLYLERIAVGETEKGRAAQKPTADGTVRTLFFWSYDRAGEKGVYMHTLWDCEGRAVLTFHTRLHKKKAPFEEIECRTESGRIVFVRAGKELGEYLWKR